jgi:macrolide-specific efflux system membrane fusion protein
LKHITQWTVLTLSLILASGLGLSACKSGKKSKGASYRSVQVARGPVSITIKSTGNVQPLNRLEVDPPVAGRVEKILVVEGQYVKKGQVLALISSTERAALLDAAAAKGPAELAHWQDIFKATPMLAPMSGQVINVEVDAGQVLSASTGVVVLSDHLIVDAQVDETDIGKIKVGKKANLTLDAYSSQPFQGYVSQIRYEAKTVNNVTMYEAYVLPKSVPKFMRSGMTVNVEFLVDGKDDALLVPTEAIQTSKDGKITVLVPGAKGERPHSVEVVAGLTNGTQTEVTSGLAEGDMVLIQSFSAASASAAANPFMPSRRPAGGGGGGGGGGGPR